MLTRKAGDPLGARSGARVVFDGKFTEGRDGYLFMADDNNQVMAQHAGRLRLDEAQLDGWRRVLEGRTEMLAGHGCAHLVMVAPDNHSVYPEKLPEGVEAAADRPIHQLMAHLDRSGSPVKIIYPLDRLLAEKGDHQVCSRVDSHWSDYGAFLAYMRLMEDARPLVPTRMVDMDDVLFLDIVVQGDLGEKMDPPRSATQEFARMRSRFARLVYDNCVEGTGALAASRCDVAPPTTCLLLGDSYAYYLLAFLSECWRRLVLAHAPTLDIGVVEAARPDIAVSVIAERYLVAVPDDAKGPAMCDREREKRADGRVRHPLMYWSWPNMLSASPVELMRARLLREGRTRDAALVGVIAYAGLRPAEAMGLRWSAIGAGSIVVEPLPRARAAGGRQRQVPLWPPLADDLEAWRTESEGGGRRFVFFAPGKAWGVDLQDWRTNTYPDLAREVGIDSPAPGDLRTVYCALLIDAGLRVEDVAELADMEAAVVENGFHGLLMHARRSPWRPVERAIAKARAAAAPLAETPLDSGEAFL